eukprot:1013908-Pyramimonas_sp.AAC.1
MVGKLLYDVRFKGFRVLAVERARGAWACRFRPAGADRSDGGQGALRRRAAGRCVRAVLCVEGAGA